MVFFAVALLVSLIPAVHAVNCSLQFGAADYPPSVDPGQSFRVKTQFDVVCSQSKSYLVGRVDVVETASGVILSSTSVPIGYFGSPDGGTLNASAVNDVVAPSLQANWTLQVKATLFASGGIGVGGAEGTPFTIMVGHAPPRERLEPFSIQVNGDFEKGLDGWEVDMNAGFLTITNKVAHSGSSALKLEMPQAPLPSGRIFGAMTISVSQAMSVENLRSLRVRAWMMDGCYVPPYFSGCSVGGNGRLRVQVGGFTEGYGFGDCSAWCLIDHNVTEDLRPGLTLAQFASIFHSDRAVSVTISLELLNGGSYFVTYLDDVQVNASVPFGLTPFSSQSLHGFDMSNQGGIEANMNAATVSKTLVLMQPKVKWVANFPLTGRRDGRQ